jgi:phenylalanyl-tRNA synthetase beta chain
MNKNEVAVSNFAIENRAEELCPRYTARIIKGVEVKESPFWLQRLLMFSGVRPINNIVDITNYVLLETGNPIHAFDLRLIEGGKIVIEKAKSGEHFITLDEQERELPEGALMIKDGAKSVAIAGIMGGLNTEITDDTKDVLIESATFDADSVRRSSRALGLRTEASSRYEKGISPETAGLASERVWQLIQETNPEASELGFHESYPSKPAAINIPLRTERANQILGTNLSEKETAAILEKLFIETEISGKSVHSKIPYFRLDLREEIDLVEEVARIHGYGNIGASLPAGNLPAEIPPRLALANLIKKTLNALSLTEMTTYSFVSPKGFDDINLPKDAAERAAIKLLNPLGDETSIMRTILLPNVLNALALNFSRRNEGVRLFELGNIFLGADLETEERLSLAIGMSGKGAGFFELKGIIEKLLKELGITRARFEADTENKSYDAGKCARLLSPSGESLGIFGALHPVVTANHKIKGDVFAGEFDAERLIEISNLKKKYKKLPVFPEILRDISIVVGEDVTVSQVEAIVKTSAKKLLEKNELVDIYRGDQIGEGKKSLSFRQVYRASDRTLTDAEAEKIQSKFVARLEDELDAVLRDNKSQ